MEDHLISIIVPVYNVEKYLDQCIESIIAQTYANLEIILINDGSTDSSGDICLKWQKQDERIIYVVKKNESQGPARNLGVQMARGVYIAFVDSDDWLDKEYIAKMYQCVLEDNCDFVRCDYYQAGGSEYVVIDINGYFPFDDDGKRRMIGSGYATTIWCGLYKRDLWTENKILMPSIPHQDFAIMGLPFIYADKISVCKEALYFYREGRNGNTTNVTAGTRSFLTATRELINEYKKRGLFETYKSELMQVAIRSLNDVLCKYDESKSEETKNVFEAECRDFLTMTFDFPRLLVDKNIIAIGDYNLQRGFTKLYYHADINAQKYQHSSIISIMSEKGHGMKEMPPGFKGMMVKRDWNRDVTARIKQGKVDYLLIDFIEERYDLLRFPNSTYITYSDALQETMAETDSECIIKRNSIECAQLWQKSCKSFIALLKEYLKAKQVILVKLYLAEYYGTYGKETQYGNVEDIRKMNALLDGYYNFFEEHFEGIQVVEISDKYFYTDKGLKYGCLPWHLNKYAHYEIQYQIRNVIERLSSMQEKK